MFALLQHVTATALHTARRALAECSREQRHAGNGALCAGVSGAAVGHRRCRWQPVVCRGQERCLQWEGWQHWVGTAALGDRAAVEAQAAPGPRHTAGEEHGPCCASAAPPGAKTQVSRVTWTLSIKTAFYIQLRVR